jgi:hypothetical protein
MNRFPDFGKELRRSFEVHENCYECASFYDGCPAWPAAREFACRQCDRLPDVPSGTCGQQLPPFRRQVSSRPASDPIETQSTRSNRGPAPEPQGTTAPKVDDLLAKESDRESKTKTRTCPCGLPRQKGKRLCEKCRKQNRRETKRRHMGPYMRRRRSKASGSG